MSPGKAGRSKNSRTRVLIVDDHPTLRYGLSQLIDQEPDLSVCGEAEDAADALAAVKALSPDVVIVDISLGQSSGLQLIKEIQAAREGLPILVLTMHDESAYAERSLRAGARGYVMKQEATGRITEGIRQVAQGRLYVSERMSQRMMEGFLDDRQAADPSPLARLSDRELEVFRLTGQGLSTREIAQSLNRSRKTIESHHARIKEKLNLDSARELFQLALQWVHRTDGSSTPP